MPHVKRTFVLTRSVLLLAIAAACADQPAAPGAGPEDASFAASAGAARTPRDVPAVAIDLPAARRPWDGDAAALAQAVHDGGGYAVVAFKETGSPRALESGRRGAVTAGTVRAGLQLLERNGAEVLDLLDGIGAARVRIAPQAAAAIAGHPLVDFVEPRRYLRLQAQAVPWGITLVGAPGFWTTYGSTGAGARVLIIDTGHQQNHEDLPAVPTANCAGGYGGCNDGGAWHGTHVLGIVAARNNTLGVVGVAPGISGADVFMYGACDSGSGFCSTDEVATGISAGIWNVHVMNLSLAGDAYDAGMATAVAQAWSSGIVIVAAAGDDLSSTLVYPAAYTNVIGVSGVLGSKAFAGAGTTACGYSNHGSHVDLSAPFEAYGTLGVNTYGTLCGTSVAAPHVTGVAALLKSRHPAWSNQQIVANLFANAEDRGAVGRDNFYGHGIVRVIAAPRANITGTASINAAGPYTWQANATGGDGAYTYSWQYRVQGAATWTTVGTGASYSRTVAVTDPDFELRVTVASGGLTGSDSHLVNVTTPVLNVRLEGPNYMRTGEGATWAAFVTGAAGVVIYQWQYRSDISTTWTNVGTSTSVYTRTAGLRSFYIRVTVTSAGASDSDEMYVGVDSGQECENDGGQRICW